MEQKTVSIVMATYNGSRYIKEQIDSILSQTYAPLEIIFVDDCSTDGTLDILDEYSKHSNNITVLLNKTNLGVTATFNRGVEVAKGDFIALADQDDIWVNNKIEILINGINGYDVVYGNSLLVDNNGISLNKDFKSLMNLQTFTSGAPFLISNTVPGHAMFIKSSFLKKILPFPTNIYFDLWIAYNAAGNNGIAYIDEVLVLYRQHSSNAVGTSQSQNKKIKKTTKEEFEKKKKELLTLQQAPITHKPTQSIVDEMVNLFSRNWSFKRALFFFKNYDALLSAKAKPTFRKKLYCLKMFFKPNF